MSENYRPLPQESEYIAAAKKCQEDYDKYGGPWVRMMSDELGISSPRSMSEEVIRRETASVAFGVEDGYLPYFRATHSFARGMHTGYRMVSLVHPQPMKLDRVLSLFKNSVDVEPQEDGTLLERGDGNLEAIGETGLDHMGKTAASYVHAWARDMTPHERLQQLIARGTGAVVLAAYALHVDQNFDFVNAYFKNNDYSSELDDILASDTGEL